MQKQPRERSWIDVTNLILGALLFILPWVFSSPNTAVEWNAWIIGGVVAFNAGCALGGFAAWEEWTNLILGVWAVITPWLFGFQANVGDTWSFVLVGCSVAALAGTQLWITRSQAGLTG